MSELSTESGALHEVMTWDANDGAFSMIPDATLDIVFSFIGPGYYRYINGTSRRFRKVYQYNNKERNRSGKETFWRNASATVACAELVLEDYRLLQKQDSDIKDALYTISMEAVKTGNVAVLEWARQNGFEFWVRSSDFERIARLGHVSVLEWIDSTNAIWNYDFLLRGAAEAGNVNVLDWIRSRGRHRQVLLKEEHKELIWRHAAEMGQVTVLAWLIDNNLRPIIGESIWWTVSTYGHVHALDWLVENGREIPRDNVVVEGGVRGGHIPVLEWAQSHGGVFTVEDCADAAFYGHLAVLQWLRANDCPWDGSVLAYAARKGHDHVVEWARANGCPEF